MMVMPLHSHQYSLEAINDAIADLGAGHIQGRAIIVPENART